MENKYKVFTFRGWEYATDYPKAIKIAFGRVHELIEQLPEEPGKWWARIDYTFCVGKTRAYAIGELGGAVKLRSEKHENNTK